jgi:hypothetical protein
MAKISRKTKYSSRELRSTRYLRPSSHCSFKRIASQVPTLAATEKFAWKDALCPVCIERPHDAVLLLCSSHDKGCRPYVCGTDFLQSNCLEQLMESCRSPGSCDIQAQWSSHARFVVVKLRDIHWLSLPESSWTKTGGAACKMAAHTSVHTDNSVSMHGRSILRQSLVLWILYIHTDGSDSNSEPGWKIWSVRPVHRPCDSYCMPCCGWKSLCPLVGVERMIALVLPTEVQCKWPIRDLLVCNLSVACWNFRIDVMLLLAQPLQDSVAWFQQIQN